VSKGGLLYHFPSKEALVDALVDDWLDSFEAGVAERARDRRWARAYAEVCAAGPQSADERATDVALLAAIAGDPSRLGAVRRRYAAWQRKVAADADDPVDATVVRLAADGLRLADLLGLAAPGGGLRRDVVRRLAELSGR
jgi:AcrR family transcriptional regulator